MHQDAAELASVEHLRHKNLDSMTTWAEPSQAEPPESSLLSKLFEGSFQLEPRNRVN